MEVEKQAMTAEKAFEIVKKIIATLPVIFALYAKIQAARDASSAGGQKITVEEWGHIVKSGAEKLFEAAKTVFGLSV